ncbi:hypothetical protein [uncultured Roseobacter sp.]|uniref:hypothetical protein n=1 Tax=uncultured Roseobacter sp. TaxID=114847 RepID=UPI0026032D2F|nr:hypothetical protein [uncultured Roseobacter sp.]
MPFAAWEQSVFELRQNNRNAASLTQGVVDRAIKRIKEIDAQQCALRQLGPIGDTYDQIKRAQKETFWGLSLGSNPELGPSPSHENGDGPQGLLSNQIEHDLNAKLHHKPFSRAERAYRAVDVQKLARPWRSVGIFGLEFGHASRRVVIPPAEIDAVLHKHSKNAQRVVRKICLLRVRVSQAYHVLTLHAGWISVAHD